MIVGTVMPIWLYSRVVHFAWEMTSRNTLQETLLYNNHLQRRQSLSETNIPTVREKCAINFYGLPRSFRKLVLPSLLQKCD
jgi:hypothetical protein